MRLSETLYWVACGFVGPWFTARGDSNVYLLRGPEGFVMVDAGCGEEPELLERQQRWDGVRPEDVKAILLTHAHSDHAGGLRFWKERCGARVCVPEAAAAYIERGGEYHHGKPGESVVASCAVDRAVKDGEEFELAGLKFKAFATPGHSDTAMCFATETEGRRLLLSGDSFYWGGKTTVFYFPDADRVLFRRSLERLQEVDFDAFLPGHRYPVLREGKRHLALALAELDRQMAGLPPMGG